MSTMIFVNLPVKDLERSKHFYTKLGYTINEQFTDENAACVVISDTIYTMLLVEPFFSNFTTKDIADATKTTEVAVALMLDGRRQVDQVVDNALASGGSEAKGAMDEPPMYQRSFYDPDGHLWEIGYMDMSAAQG